MNVGIRETGAIQLAGLTRKVRTADGENLRAIPAFWDEITKEKAFDKLFADYQENGILNGAMVGACLDHHQDEFTYMIALEPSPSSDLSGMETRTIPEQTWAVFPGHGPMPETIQNTWKQIYTDWLPASAFKHSGGPELEIYPSPVDEHGNMQFEVWIPVVRR